MLRLWVTLYYGYWLFFFGLTSFTGVRGQGQNPLNEVPSSVWWKGDTVTFYKYRNDGSCRQIAMNSSVPNSNDINGYVGFNQNGAWFGGADKITFKLDGTSCVRVSTHRGEYVQMLFQSGQQGCSVGSGQSVMGDLRYFDHPECRINEHRNQVNFMEIGGSTPLDGGICFNDRGVGGPPYAVYYRAFCDVSRPIPVATNAVVNNITHYVTNVVSAPLNVSAITDIVRANIPPQPLPPPPAVLPSLNVTEIVAIIKAHAPPTLNQTELRPFVQTAVSEALIPLFIMLGLRDIGSSRPPPAAVVAQNNTASPQKSDSASIAIGLGWLALYVAAAYSFFM